MSEPITDQRVIQWSNTRLRPLADHIRQVYDEVGKATAEWELMQSLIPPDPAAFVADGTPESGRWPVSGADIWGLLGIPLPDGTPGGIAFLRVWAETPGPQGVAPITGINKFQVNGG